MPVNLLGNSCDYKAIKEICFKHKLLLIEDNCESMGAKFNNQYTGTFGLAGSFSFFFSHHMQTMEGGMIVTDDLKLAEYCKSLRAHGWDRGLRKNDNNNFNFVNSGFNRCMELN